MTAVLRGGVMGADESRRRRPAGHERRAVGVHVRAGLRPGRRILMVMWRPHLSYIARCAGER